MRVYDIETLKSFFLYVDCNEERNDLKIFCLNEYKNDWDEFLNHLGKLVKSKEHQIGYNNVNFDAQVLNFIMKNHKMMSKLSTKDKISIIYNYVQDIITRRNRNEWLDYREKDFLIPQIDLFKIHHFDNRAKMTRLKDVQIAINWHNVKDMPISHDKLSLSFEEINDIISYCKNDVFSTLEFFKISLQQINLRKDLSETFNINLMNANDPKIGSEIFLSLLSKKLNISTWEIKNMRTYRDKIILKDIILPSIKFKNEKLKKILNKFDETIIQNTKGEFKSQCTINNITYYFATGGLHACIKSGIYEAGDEYLIKDIDVSSFYPNISIKNNLFPEHLTKEFCKIYKYLYDERKRIDKKDSRNGAYKLMLNSAYGKSNDIYSFFYDPKYTMSVTVNGQLLLAMLVDSLLEYEILQVNTDGVTVRYKKEDDQKISKICKSWENITGFELEYAMYQKMIIRDVNNYIGIYTDGKIKLKGAYEVDKKVGNDIVYYKDTSFKIVPYSILKYFKDGILIEDTIKNCEDIFMFVGRAKFKSDSYGETRAIEKGNKVVEKQQKTTRYYISNNGRSFVKVYLTRPDENGNRKEYKEEIINKGFKVTIYNLHRENIKIDSYNIDYNFYIEEAYKLIDNIVDLRKNNTQLKLF